VGLTENPFDARCDQMQWKSDRDPRATLTLDFSGGSRTQGGAAFCGPGSCSQRKEDNFRWPVAARSGKKSGAQAGRTQGQGP